MVRYICDRTLTADSPFAAGFIIDADYGANFKEPKCTPDVAFISYMLSSYHKEFKKGAVTAGARIRVKVADTHIVEFLNLKGFTAGLAQDQMTDGDIGHGCVLMLNGLVNAMRAEKKAGMHPLSRRAFSENALGRLASFFTIPVYDAVKLANVSCVRKAHQFQDVTKYYDPELAAAVILNGVYGTNKNVSKTTKDIARANIGKIVAAARRDFNEGKLFRLMDIAGTGTNGFDFPNILDG